MDPTPQKSVDLVSREKVSPYFQMFMILLSTLVLVAGFYLRMEKFSTADEPVRRETLTPKKLKEFGGAPEYIDVGLHINRFQEFDVTKNKFQFFGSVWFQFEAGALSIETLRNFTFDRGTILYRSEPDTSLDGTRLMVRYNVQVAFNTGLVFSDFPLDDHRINLVLTHPFLAPEEAIFDSKTTDFKYSGNLIPFGWKLVGQSVTSGFSSAIISDKSPDKPIKQPIVGFSLDVERYGARYVLAILLPILLLHFIIYFCLSVDANPSVTIALGSVTGMLAYRYVIEQLSPLTGDLMLSDYFFFLFLASSGIIFLFNNIDLFVVKLPIKIKKLGIILNHLLVIVISLILLA
jgi:hypothetical protein